MSGGGGRAPVSLGSRLVVQSSSLNVFVRQNPATVQIEARQNFSVAAYGGLFSQEPQSFSLAAGHFGPVRLVSFMPNFNLAAVTSGLQISAFGDYEINFMVRIAAASASASLAVGVELNGGNNFLPSTLQSGPLSTANDTLFQGSSIVTLSSGDRIVLGIQALTNATFSLSANMNASLSAKRLTPFPADGA